MVHLARSWPEPAPSGSRLTSVGMRCKRLICVAFTGLIVAGGCGDADNLGGASGALADPSAPPATRAVLPTPDDYASVTAVDASEVSEPCPAEASVDMDAADSSAVVDESSRLEPMLGVVLRYGSERADVFGGYGLHWHSVGDASVFVSFTGDLESHREALMAQVEFPDELIVCQAAASEADRNAIQATLVDELSGRFTSIGAGGKSGRVTVGLNPTEVELAAELVERYGTAVDVSVGALDYPLDDAQAQCPPTLDANMIDGLTVTVVDTDAEREVSPAGTVALTVRLTNTSNNLITFGSGHPTSVITDASSTPRTIDTRGVADVGIEITIEPGAHQDFEIEVSLGSCDPGDGYLLAAGEHFVVVSIYNSELQRVMNSEPLPITIVN